MFDIKEENRKQKEQSDYKVKIKNQARKIRSSLYQIQEDLVEMDRLLAFKDDSVSSEGGSSDDSPETFELMRTALNTEEGIFKKEFETANTRMKAAEEELEKYIGKGASDESEAAEKEWLGAKQDMLKSRRKYLDSAVFDFLNPDQGLRIQLSQMVNSESMQEFVKEFEIRREEAKHRKAKKEANFLKHLLSNAKLTKKEAAKIASSGKKSTPKTDEQKYEERYLKFRDEMVQKWEEEAEDPEDEFERPWEDTVFDGMSAEYIDGIKSQFDANMVRATNNNDTRIQEWYNKALAKGYDWREALYTTEFYLLLETMNGDETTHKAIEARLRKEYGDEQRAHYFACLRRGRSYTIKTPRYGELTELLVKEKVKEEQARTDEDTRYEELVDVDKCTTSVIDPTFFVKIATIKGSSLVSETEISSAGPEARKYCFEKKWLVDPEKKIWTSIGRDTSSLGSKTETTKIRLYEWKPDIEDELVTSDPMYKQMAKSIYLFRNYAPKDGVPQIFFDTYNRFIKYDATKNWWTAKPLRIVAPGAVENYKDLRTYERDDLKRKYRAEIIEQQKFNLEMQKQYKNLNLGSIFGAGEPEFTEDMVRDENDIEFWNAAYQEAASVTEVDENKKTEIVYKQDEVRLTSMDDDDDDDDEFGGAVMGDDDEFGDASEDEMIDEADDESSAPAPGYVAQIPQAPDKLKDLLVWARKTRVAVTRYAKSTKESKEAKDASMADYAKTYEEYSDSDDEDFEYDKRDEASDEEDDRKLEEEFRKKGEDGTGKPSAAGGKKKRAKAVKKLKKGQ